MAIDATVDVKKPFPKSFAVPLLNGVRTVKRQNRNGKRPFTVCPFPRTRKRATPTFSDRTTLQYGSSEAHFDTL